jgi:DNA-binding MarR family transcriptional regulator
LADERRSIVEHIITMDRRFGRNFHPGWAHEWAEVDLTMPQLKVLFVVVYGGGVNMTSLAHSLSMTLSTLTGVVDRLANQGLVGRQFDAHDRRAVLLHPTEKGSELAERLAQAGRERMKVVLERLSLEDLQRLSQALDTLCEVAGHLDFAGTTATE